MQLRFMSTLLFVAMKAGAYISATIFTLILFSCEHVKRKSSDVLQKSMETIREKKNTLTDKIIPTFDSYHADTKFNKKRFEDFFGFAPTPDVRELYCFADQTGIDSKFIFSFTGDTTTKNKIVANLKLIQSDKPDNFSSGLWEAFPWWDSSTITTLHPYYSQSDHGYYKYLWFDPTKQKLYYIDFDM